MESDLCNEKIADLVSYFSGEIYKTETPSQHQAEADVQYLTTAIKQTLDDWIYAVFDGERE